MRISGFGYGDESLENDISQVELKIDFGIDNERMLDNKHKKFSFDLMIFESTEDYLCYVEAVHLLYHESVKKNCNFILDS